MKTATCALVADTSKFDGPIDQAKAKLSAFGQVVQKTASVAQTVFNVFNSARGIASGINEIATAVENVKAGMTALKSIGVNVSSALSAVGNAGKRALAGIASLPPVVKVLGGVALVSAASLYGIYKSGQAVAGIAKGVVIGIGSITAKLGEMSKSAITSAMNLAKVGAQKGFSAISGVVGVATKALGLLGVSLGGLDVFFKAGVVSAFQLGDSLKTLRDRTGASIPFIYDLQKAFKNAGMSGDAVAPVLQSMGRALTGVNADGEPTNKMFQRLGLNVEDLAKLPVEQQFKKITDSIAKLKSPAERSAAAVAIFGRSAAGLTAVIAEGGIDKLGQNITGPAKVLAENADTFSAISVELRKSGEMFRGFFVMIAGKIGAPLLAIMKSFSGGQFLEGVGEKIGTILGDGLTIFANAIQQGKIFDLLREGFITAIMVAGDTLLRYMSAAISAIVQMWNEGLIQNGVKTLLSGFISATQVMGGYLLKIFQAPIVYLQAGIQLAVEKLLEGLGKIPVLGEKLGLSGFRAGSFGEIKKGIEEGGGASFFGQTANEMISAGTEGLAKATEAMTSVATKGAQVFADSLASQGEVIGGTTEQVKKFGDQIESLKGPIEGVKSKAGAVVEEGTALTPPEGGTAGKRSTAEAAVSSLQRIGGGGVAFGGDPILKNAEKQTSLQEKMVQELQKQNKMAEKGGGVEAGGFSYAVLA